MASTLALMSATGIEGSKTITFGPSEGPGAALCTAAGRGRGGTDVGGRDRGAGRQGGRQEQQGQGPESPTVASAVISSLSHG